MDTVPDGKQPHKYNPFDFKACLDDLYDDENEESSEHEQIQPTITQNSKTNNDVY